MMSATFLATVASITGMVLSVVAGGCALYARRLRAARGTAPLHTPERSNLGPPDELHARGVNRFADVPRWQRFHQQSVFIYSGQRERPTTVDPIARQTG